MYTSFIVLVCWDDYIVTYLDGISLAILDAELAEGDIKEGILAPFAIRLIIFVILLIICATFIGHTYLTRFRKMVYLA